MRPVIQRCLFSKIHHFNVFAMLWQLCSLFHKSLVNNCTLQIRNFCFLVVDIVMSFCFSFILGHFVKGQQNEKHLLWETLLTLLGERYERKDPRPSRSLQLKEVRLLS